jgi:quercetin dioxygenase-like cupin family protein
MDEERLKLAPGTELRVLEHEPHALVLEATYEGGGAEPPGHLHPGQHERFEVLAGAMRTRIDGEEGTLSAGETLEIRAGTPHQMWNAGAERATMRWTTTPAGRTLDWFREVSAMLAGEPLSEPATLLERYDDVFRLT